MILIERLVAHHFKQLRDIDLTFPPSGRVLIEGLNEAGKSTLFEAVHFALYGRGLVTHGPSVTDSLIAYGADGAAVEVVLRIDDRSLRVARTLRRGHPTQAVCEVRWADGTSEAIRQTKTVNREVLKHLHGLDSDALLASCLVEQKKLGKLEDLTRDKRQEVLLKLLNLDRLTRVKRRFLWGRTDDQELQIAEQKLRLAEATRRIDVLTKELADTERQITLVQIALNLAEADEYASRAATTGRELGDLARQLTEVQCTIARIEKLDRAIDLLQKVLDSDQAAIRSRMLAEEYERRLAELDDIERETIPVLAAEARTLEAMGENLSHLAELDGKAADLRSRQERVAAGEREIDDPELDERVRVAYERVRRASLIEALRAWGQAKREIDARERGATLIADLDRAAEAAETEHREAAQRVQQTTRGVGISLAVTIMGILGLVLGPLSLLLILVGAGLLVWSWRRRSAAARALARARALLDDKRAAARDERIRQETLREKVAPNLVGLAEKVRLMHGSVPNSPEHAEAIAHTLEATLPPGWSLNALRTDARAIHVRCLVDRLDRITERRQALERAVSEQFRALATERTASGPADRDLDGENQVEASRLGSVDALLKDVVAGQRAVLQWRGRVDQHLEYARGRLRERPELQRRFEIARDEANAHQSQWSARWAELRPILGLASEVLPSRSFVESQRATLHAERIRLDLETAREESDRLIRQQGTLSEQKTQAKSQEDEKRRAVRELVEKLGIVPPADICRNSLLPLIPDLASIPNEPRELLQQLEAAQRELRDKRAAEEGTAVDLEAKLHLDRADLDEGGCREEARWLGHRKRVCQCAEAVLDEVRERVLTAVLPNTLTYMRLWLPLLTAGRYHDAQLDSESYRIEVWDNQVQDFVVKDVFSGATQDQFSLSLRLGFAVAALPQERGVRPGFLFLDEPVAGFDGQRRNALLDLLASAELTGYFPQVFFAVPSGVFERNPLEFLVRLDNGRVIESTVPPASEVRTDNASVVEVSLPFDS